LRWRGEKFGGGVLKRGKETRDGYPLDKGGKKKNSGKKAICEIKNPLLEGRRIVLRIHVKRWEKSERDITKSQMAAREQLFCQQARK